MPRPPHPSAQSGPRSLGLRVPARLWVSLPHSGFLCTLICWVNDSTMLVNKWRVPSFQNNIDSIYALPNENEQYKSFFLTFAGLLRNFCFCFPAMTTFNKQWRHFRYIIEITKGVYNVFANEEHRKNGQKMNYEVNEAKIINIINEFFSSQVLIKIKYLKRFPIWRPLCETCSCSVLSLLTVRIFYTFTNFPKKTLSAA